MKNNNTLSKNRYNILIVDDIPANLTVLGDILDIEGYKVRQVTSGRLVLQMAEKEKPDLILLDIMMPDMNGFEVCRRLKECSGLREIPVIFISALTDTDDVVNALDSGGVDYITKPFHAEEIIARVATHLKLYRQKKELQNLNAQKDRFFAIIAHDLRGPLSSFMGLTELLAEDSPDLEHDQKKELAVAMSESARNIFNLLNNLLQWSLMQRGQTSFTPQKQGLMGVVTECLKAVEGQALKKAVEIAVDIPGGLEVSADSNMLQSIVRNLVSNAVKFTLSGGNVLISARNSEDNMALISVKDSGIGMSKEILDDLFLIDAKSGRRGTEDEPSTGLGLVLCKEFVEKHGGRIWAESEEGKGSVLYFSLPHNHDQEV